MSAPACIGQDASNEPQLSYLRGSGERDELQRALNHALSEPREIPVVVDGKRYSTRETATLVAPHDRRHVLAIVSQATRAHTELAIKAACAARADWSQWPLAERAAVFLKAADLLAGPWRQRLNAATMLGQSKTVYQAEIDSACELIDFLRFNVQFAYEIDRMQPRSPNGVQNCMEYRALEGFVYAVTPFNFTAIGGNLAAAPAIMGNAVIWKPSAAAALSNYLILELLQEAGLPPGVINFLPGDPLRVSEAMLRSEHLAGIHFTGSTQVFDGLWRTVGQNVSAYRTYPRLVGETGGKDFVLAHSSADVDSLVVALIRGAFEYQGQKCSAASRAYIPRSLWPKARQRLLDQIDSIRMGDVCAFDNFMGAVIDQKAFDRISAYIERARQDPTCRILAGGVADASVGYFMEPTVIEVDYPHHELMAEEIFGPVLAVFVYDDTQWSATLDMIDTTSPYALTGAVFARSREAIRVAQVSLRNCAGNFYINDKPTGAVVGQQPFGGARRSGTNDKAGSPLNLLRWSSPRTIKETRLPQRQYWYPYMERDESGPAMVNTDPVPLAS